MNCKHCRDAGNLFNKSKAKRDLNRYQNKGPETSTELLLEMIRSSSVPMDESSLLDVGGGIGAIQFELFEDGLQQATSVDASSPYLQKSKAEARRRNLFDRINYHFGDVVDLAPALPAANIVTLDRVICCYPDPEKLINATTTKAPQLYGVVYPRIRLVTKIGIKLGNLWSRLWNNEFRMYLFSPTCIDRLIRDQGFIKQARDQTFLWNITLYSREG